MAAALRASSRGKDSTPGEWASPFTEPQGFGQIGRGMHLWSDYEGKTIAEEYRLEQLIRPEGRSAFFATTVGAGTPAVMRLTEAVNDQEEMLARWRQVSALEQEHLVAIQNFGQTQFEGTPLTYALMEPADATLADILKERPLTPAETREVAVSLVDAMTALHSNGLFHGQVEPANVVAVGEVVKLRSDCVREYRPENAAERIAADVQGLATVLLDALTLETTPHPAHTLPAPFDRIVRHGLDGSWGLKEIDAALTAPPAEVEEWPSAPYASASPAHFPDEPDDELLPYLPAASFAAALAEAEREPAPAFTDFSEELEPQPRRLAWWAGCAAGLILLLALGWHWLHPRPAARASAPAAAAAEVQAAPVAASATAPASPVRPAAPRPNHPAVVTAQTQSGWHVVAFTYNYVDQAMSKAMTIRRSHPALNPEVFSPTGRAPYFVALGGCMTERAADEMKDRARRDGMPRDTFIRRYGKGRG